MEWHWIDEPDLPIEFEVLHSHPLASYLVAAKPTDSAPRCQSMRRYDRGRMVKATLTLWQWMRALYALDRLPKEYRTAEWLEWLAHA